MFSTFLPQLLKTIIFSKCRDCRVLARFRLDFEYAFVFFISFSRFCARFFFFSRMISFFGGSFTCMAHSMDCNMWPFVCVKMPKDREPHKINGLTDMLWKSKWIQTFRSFGSFFSFFVYFGVEKEQRISTDMSTMFLLLLNNLFNEYMYKSVGPECVCLCVLQTTDEKKQTKKRVAVLRNPCVGLQSL